MAPPRKVVDEKTDGNRSDEVWEEVQREMEAFKEDLQKIPKLERGLELVLGKLELLRQKAEPEQGKTSSITGSPAGGTFSMVEGKESSGGGWDDGPRSVTQTCRIEMRTFDGTNPDGWIFRVERLFAMNRTGEAKKLEAAVVSLDSDALAWFQWEDGTRAIWS